MPRIAYWIRNDDYEAFKRLSPGDPHLPDTFDTWLKLAERQVSGYATHGTVVKKVDIDPDRFAVYCEACGRDFGEVSRQMFAVATAAESGDDR